MTETEAQSFSCRASWAAADEAARWLEVAAQLVNVTADDLNSLLVCLEEVLTNIVKNNADNPPDISVEFHGTGERLYLSIKDTGKMFDVAAALPRRASGSLDDLEPGGLGLQLIRSFSSDLRYRRDGVFNEVSLVFERAGNSRS